jgi:hypothetical protein
VITATPAEVTLWRSSSGRRFERWLVEPAGGATRVGLAVSPTYAVDHAVFVGLGRRVLTPMRHAEEVRHGERRPIWRSTELGPGVVNVTSIAVLADGMFAATNAGVHVSRDRGQTFVPWSTGLTNPRVVAVALSATDRHIYALSLGGALSRRLYR